jgi:DNA primase
MAALRRYVDSVILFFDSDSAGEAAGERAAGIAMRHSLRVRLAKVPEGKDPAGFLETAGAEAFTAVLNSAVDALGFLWDRTLARFQNHSGGQDRGRAVGEFVHLVGDLSRFGAVDAIQRGLIINQVAGLLGLPVAEVSGMFAAPSKRRESPAVETAGIQLGGRRQRLSGIADGEQLALTELLSVLLCRPELLAEVSDVFHPDRFSDPDLRDMAERFVQRAAASDCRFSAIVASMDSPTAISRLTDLMLSAEDKGNHEETLLALRRRLLLLEGERAGREAASALKNAKTAEPWSDLQLDSHLVALQEGFSRRHGFSPSAVQPSQAGRSHS